MKRPKTFVRIGAVALASALVLAGCGSDDGGDDSNGDSKNSAKRKDSDGKLTIGTLLPATGDLAFLGPPEFAGVKMAINDINKAGGVLGEDVTEVKGDSGDGTPDIAGAQVDKLLDGGSDVILGAASSSVSLSVINKITAAGAVQFSPANTSPEFDQKKTDPSGLYFRTAPSDVLQGSVLANQIVDDGHNKVAILARQDSYGELLASEVKKGIEDAGGTVVANELYAADATNYTAEVTKVAAAKPDAIAVIAFNETTKLVPTMIGAGIGPKKQQVYFVDGNAADYSEDFKKGTLKGVKATYPGAELTGDFKKRLLATDPKLKDFTYAPESYDAVIMTSLAATAADSDVPADFAPEIIKISEGGTKCKEYSECVKLLKDGEDIDYDGVSGPVDMGEAGSPTKATIGIFEYGDDNTYKNTDYITGVIE